MLVPFKDLPADSRIWIYQANRTIQPDELTQINEQAESFLSQWTAHGSDLQAGFLVPYNRFIVIGLDGGVAQATGCSIDASVHFIQDLEKQFDLDLMDKMNVSYRNGEYIAYKDLKDFRTMAKNRSVSGKTIVFNNLVATKEDFENHWEVQHQKAGMPAL